LREELGDVLLQVLFHARVAAEGGVAPFAPDGEPFDVDAVATDLVRKLVDRHPHVFGPGEGAGERVHAEEIRTASDQELRWDELKRVEKRRDSSTDGVALSQPAAALAAKLVSRARKAGLPEPLAATGDELFDLVATLKVAGEDPEQRLRTAAREFAARVRAAEDAARSAGLDPHALGPDDWHRYWPSGPAERQTG
jgi:XTP/dITP diphosphohydrolase